MKVNTSGAIMSSRKKLTKTRQIKIIVNTDYVEIISTYNIIPQLTLYTPMHEQKNVNLKIYFCIPGETLFPFSASLVCVWDTLVMSLGFPLRQVSVQFSNLNLNTQPRLYEDRVLQLHVQITKGNGDFEVLKTIFK